MPTNDDSRDFMKLMGFLLAIGTAIVASVVGIEARIEAAVTKEALERKSAISKLETRLTTRLDRIEGKIDAVLVNQAAGGSK